MWVHAAEGGTGVLLPPAASTSVYLIRSISVKALLFWWERKFFMILFYGRLFQRKKNWDWDVSFNFQKPCGRFIPRTTTGESLFTLGLQPFSSGLQTETPKPGLNMCVFKSQLVLPTGTKDNSSTWHLSPGFLFFFIVFCWLAFLRQIIPHTTLSKLMRTSQLH